MYHLNEPDKFGSYYLDGPKNPPVIFKIYDTRNKDIGKYWVIDKHGNTVFDGPNFKLFERPEDALAHINGASPL